MARRYMGKPKTTAGPKKSKNGLKVFLAILGLLILFLAAFIIGIYIFSRPSTPQDDMISDETVQMTMEDFKKMSKDELVAKAMEMQDEISNQKNQIDNLTEQLERYKDSPGASSTPRPTATATPKPTATVTPKPTATATPKPTATATPKPTAIATPKPTATPAPTDAGAEE